MDKNKINLDQLHQAKNHDEKILNAAFAILRENGVGDGILGVYFREPVNSFVLQFEAENSGYFEWVRLEILTLENFSEDVLLEAANRLAVRIGITFKRYMLTKLQ